MRFPFFEPILLQREEDEEEEEEDDDEIECALNAEINGKFLAFNDDDTNNGGAKKLLPDVARVVALDNLWKKKKKKRDEEEEEEERRAFVKALASVNVGGQNDDKIDVRASVEKYWERETVDGSGDGDGEEKTLGAKSFVIDAASRNGGIVGEVDLFERLERVFPQTVFARAPVESFVFNNDGGGDDGDDDDYEHRKRFKYDAIVYNASDETSTFRYHIDGCPMTLLHPQSAFAKAYGGNYANRTPTRDDENGARASVKPRFVSLLVYLNDEWDPEWGGETKFLDEDSQIGLLVAAKPGRVVLFDSDVKHSVCPTTNSSSDSNSNNNKRFSLVMKLIALPKQMFVLKKNEKEEEDVDLLRVNPHLGFGPATPIGSAKRLRSIVEATTRRRKVA